MNFDKLKLNKKLLDGVKLLGFEETTMIQERCIPEILAGKDVVGQALTGSGKTAAFGLPLLEKVVPGGGIQALILIPTRELCVQVRDVIEQMGKFVPLNIVSIYGGIGYHNQLEGIKIAEIIVATPGRLLDHMERRNIKFDKIKFVVLDEADKMFEMGFEKDVARILKQTPSTRQTTMFSATMPRAAQNIIQQYLRDPVFIKEQLHVDKSKLKQVFYSVNREKKFSLLVHLLTKKSAGPSIVFCGTKREVDRVARNLSKLGFAAKPVHGDLAQLRRQVTVNAFKSGQIEILVATDVAARGLDIKDITHIFNYDIPKTPDEYTHRIGRTARAGKKGDAVSLLSERDNMNFSRIVRHGKMQINQEPTPDFEFIEVKKEQFGQHRDYGERGSGRRSSSGFYSRVHKPRNDNMRDSKRDNFSYRNSSSNDSYSDEENSNSGYGKNRNSGYGQSGGTGYGKSSGGYNKNGPSRNYSPGNRSSGGNFKSGESGFGRSSYGSNTKVSGSNKSTGHSGSYGSQWGNKDNNASANKSSYSDNKGNGSSNFSNKKSTSFDKSEKPFYSDRKGFKKKFSPKVKSSGSKKKSKLFSSHKRSFNKSKY